MTFHGVRYRGGRSLIVFVLATVAIAAAVLAPAYTVAAQESAVADGLDDLPPARSTVHVMTQGFPGSPAYDDVADIRDFVQGTVANHPRLDAILGEPSTSVTTTGNGSAQLTGGTYDALISLTQRDDICDRLTVAEGACPLAPGEAMLSTRSAERFGFAVGDTVTVQNRPDGISERFTLVGLYEVPTDPNAYFGGALYFQNGNPNGVPTSDSLFLGTDEDVRKLAGPRSTVSVQMDFPFVAGKIRLDDLAPITADFSAWSQDLAPSDRFFWSDLPGAIDDTAAGVSAVADTVPVVAVPLMLLCWFVLFLVVANMTAARGPEVALAKLRGFSRPGTLFFGLAETLTLTVLAAPAGFLLGLGLVELTAATVLADGVHVQIDAAVFGYALLALAGAAVAAVLGAWRTLATRINDLLRRVPARRGWRGGLAEGLLFAFGAFALYQALRVRGEPGAASDPWVLMASPVLALIIGVVAARLLAGHATLMAAGAGRRGKVTAMLTWTQIARRPAIRPVVVLVTVSVSLLSFAGIAWQIGEHDRELAAADKLGAERVYEVSAADPNALLDAVEAVDPEGAYAMGGAHVVIKYNNEPVTVLAVQADRLAAVGLWRGHDADGLARVADALRPPAAEPVTLTGSVTVDADVTRLDVQDPVRLAVRILPPGEQARTVRLGDLRTGEHSYTAELPGCEDGCALVGIGLQRYPGTFDPIAIDLTVTSFADAAGDLSAVLTDPAQWRDPLGNTDLIFLKAATGAEGLTVTAASNGPNDLFAEHTGLPAAIPVIVAGGPPTAEPHAPAFFFPGISGDPQPFRMVGDDVIIPRAGRHAMLGDLEYTMLQASLAGGFKDSATLHYAVWTTSAAPADFAERLAAQGLTIEGTEYLSHAREEIDRKAPALALLLYLLAGCAAVLLAIGGVLFTTRAAAAERGYEVAALRVSGVGRGQLRRSLLREYAIIIGLPLVLGVAAGVASAWLMLPSLPLVTAGGDLMPSSNDVSGPWPPILLGVTVAGFLAAVAYSVRSMRRDGAADRLREGTR